MTQKENLISLNEFISENYKTLFSNIRFMQDHFSDICERHIDYAFSILEEKPYEALEIYTLVNKFHDTLGVMPDKILNLSEDIVVRVSYDDIEKGIDLVEIIEIECFKTKALFRIASKTKDSDLINKIAYKISLYGDAEDVVSFKNQYSKYIKMTLTEMLSNNEM